MNVGVVAVLGAVLLAGCGSLTPSVVADWKLDEGYQVAPDATALHLMVQQNDGPSGGGTPAERALPPEIIYGQDLITLTIRISTPGNGIMSEGPFPLVVQLDQPVGARDIRHGAGGTRVSPTAPPAGSTPEQVLDAYLTNFWSAGDCSYAGYSWASDRVPGDGNLCGETRLISYSVNSEPATSEDERVEFATTLNTTGTGDGTVPPGEVTWFFELTKQPSGKWRISRAGSGP